jgi:D-3-phosphoglycerate dehydrogenase
MAKYRILIADSRYPGYEEEKTVLREIIERSDKEEVLAGLVGDIDGLIVNLAPVTAKVIGAMKRCKCISRYGVGYDNVDVAALKGTGIHLANVPDYCAEDVSDQAMALFMDAVRKTARKDRHVYRIAGKTFGFVGFGMIAKTVHRKLFGFNLGRVLVADPFVSQDAAKKAGVELVSLETLLKESDYISMHAPVLPSTKGMIGAAQFAMMKKTAILINTARGPLIDEAALIDALKTGKIACAGLDVFVKEPLPMDSELRQLDNLTLVDHAGWYSKESIVELKTKAARNIVDTLKNGKPKYLVAV